MGVSAVKTASIVAAGLDPDNLPGAEAASMNFQSASGAKAWRDIWGSGQGIGAVHWHQAAGAAEVEVDLETGHVKLLRYEAAVYSGRTINEVQAELTKSFASAADTAAIQDLHHVAVHALCAEIDALIIDREATR